MELSRGKIVPAAAKKIGVTEQTYCCWKKQYGGLWRDQAKRLKDIEKESAWPKPLLADAEPHKARPQLSASPNVMARVAAVSLPQ